MAFVHCSLLGGIAFGVDVFLMLFWWCLVRCYKELVTVAVLLFYVIIFSFSAVCIRIARLDVIGIFAIIIFFYRKKYEWHMIKLNLDKFS